MKKLLCALVLLALVMALQMAALANYKSGDMPLLRKSRFRGSI